MNILKDFEYSAFTMDGGLISSDVALAQGQMSLDPGAETVEKNWLGADIGAPD